MSEMNINGDIITTLSDGYIEDVLRKGVDAMRAKKDYSNRIGSIAKNVSEQLEYIQKKELLKVKDFMHYKGNGWGANAIDKDENSETKYPDKLSTIFRNFMEAIKAMYACGLKDELFDYFRALREYGITVNVDDMIMFSPGKEDMQTINDAIADMNFNQDKINENNEYVSEVLAPAADKQNIIPKNKYGKLVGFMYNIDEGKDVEDKIQDELTENDMYTKQLEELM